MEKIYKSVEVPTGFDLKLHKDLLMTDDYHEAICPICLGTGVILDDAAYGIDEGGTVRLPYKHQHLAQCHNCYDGVIKVCNHCGEPINSYLHNCETMKEKRALKAKHNLEEVYNSAEKLSVTEAIQKFDYIYIEELDDCHDVDEYTESELKHLSNIYHIFGTKQVHMTLDADWIIENACEDLCENAYDYIGGTDIGKLQKLLDDWIAKSANGTITYYPDYKFAIEKV